MGLEQRKHFLFLSYQAAGGRPGSGTQHGPVLRRMLILSNNLSHTEMHEAAHVSYRYHISDCSVKQVTHQQFCSNQFCTWRPPMFLVIIQGPVYITQLRTVQKFVS